MTSQGAAPSALARRQDKGRGAGAEATAPRLHPADAAARWDALSLALLLCAAILVLLTFRDYGVTWDEDVHRWYGELVLDYYLSGLQDLRALAWHDLRNYGAAFDVTAAFLNRFSPLGVYETRHLLNGVVGIVGLAGCWKLGRALGGPRAGFIAALLLLLTPNYYGQMFNNPKDIPFAAGMVWGIYYLVLILPQLPRPPLRLLLKLGLAAGMTMGVRVGGLLLLCYFALMLGLDGTWRAFSAGRAAALAGIAWTSLWRAFAPVALVAGMVMMPFWPWAQQDPIRHPLEALAVFSHEVFPYWTLFDGRFVPATDLPWAYLPTYILLALPELVLVLLIGAAVLAALGLSRIRISRPREPMLAIFLLAFAIVFPVAYAIAIKAVLFDGMRHFIFVLPLIAVAAALAGDAALGSLARFPWRWPIYGALGLYGLAHVAIMAMLHPDQYVYYNGFVGGVEGAQRRFKLDYWANSYAEAVHGLEDYLRREDGPQFAARRFTVAVCGPPISADYYFPPNFRFVRSPRDGEFFIAFTKDNCDRSLPGRPVYRVERMGALLSVVLDRRALLAAGRVGKRPLADAVLTPSAAPPANARRGLP